MFYFDNFKGKKILKSTLLSDNDCFFTTREFVLTKGAREDLSSIADENRNLLKSSLGVDKIYTAKQTHSDNIAILEENKYFYDNTDALISNIENSLMLLNYADCVPIILYDKKDNIGAIIHAGWRGSASEIALKTSLKMQKELNIKAENITALIGPAIDICCFETDEDVFKKLIKNEADTKFYKKKENKYFINLKLLNALQLEKTGIKNIDICRYCTCCMSDIFFSYRKENGITARHSAVLKIKGK